MHEGVRDELPHGTERELGVVVVVSIGTHSNAGAEVSTHPLHACDKEVGYWSVKMHEVNKTIR